MADIKKAPFRADHVGSLLRPQELLQRSRTSAKWRTVGCCVAANRRSLHSRCRQDAGGYRPSEHHRR